MRRRAIRTTAPALVAAVLLAGCGSDAGSPTTPAGTAGGAAPAPTTAATDASSASGSAGGGHEHAHGSGTGAPAGMKPAPSPMYPVGSSVVLRTDHMEGMEGAKATVVGAYATTTYAVDYTPTDGGDPVHHHKWVVHEELADPGAAPLSPGTPVTIEAGHMPGMKGAKGRVVAATSETVYMVDYTPTTGEAPVRNHLWVVESELARG